MVDTQRAGEDVRRRLLHASQPDRVDHRSRCLYAPEGTTARGSPALTGTPRKVSTPDRKQKNACEDDTALSGDANASAEGIRRGTSCDRLDQVAPVGRDPDSACR